MFTFGPSSYTPAELVDTKPLPKPNNTTMRTLLLALCVIIPGSLFAQTTSIGFELNGRPSNAEIQASPEKSKNPFARFIGEWALKDETWIHNWGGETDTIKIPGHHTNIVKINTENSLLSIVDGPEPNGHIFWSYNPNTKEVGHLSSFGDIRAGTGSGAFYGEGNLRLKVSFEGEAPGSYRIYTYEWVSDDEYALKSIQFDEHDQPTGLFYQGNFVRIEAANGINKEIVAILKVLDNHEMPKEEQINVYADEVVHMAPNSPAITNKADLLAYLNQQKEYGYPDMEHQVVEISSHGDIVLMRGKVIGTFHPANGGDPIAFQTKNLFVFKRVDGELKIAKVIYNASPGS